MAHVITPILPYPELAFPLAKHDVAALNELSDASQVRAWTRRKVARYKKYITALLAIHNSIAPINKLPTEILQQVFVHVPFSSRRLGASWLVSLQSVCRRWRSVILATPEYWLRGLHVVLNPPPRMARAITHEPVFDSDEDEDEDEDEEITSYSNPRDLFLARSAPCPLELGELYTSAQYSLGWELFEDHFDRVTVFEIEVQYEGELYDVLGAIATSMPRLEKLGFSIEYESDLYPGDHLTLTQWQAEDFPRLTELKITAPLFCRATTVPSLQSITLWAHRDITSLPGLLDALEGCPALATIYLVLSDYGYIVNEASRSAAQNLDRVVNLPNLRVLEICADVSDTSCFLSHLSFPSTTKLDASIDGDIGDQFALPCILPRRLSGLHTAPTIDRLYLHSEHKPGYRDPLKPYLSMMGHVQGAERLRVSPACQLRNAADFLHFLDAFSACTVTELALDLGPLPSDMDGEFRKQFFASLPDVRRLELLSRTTQSRATKRMIAEQFLASVQILQDTSHSGCSLAWVLRVEGSDTSHMEEELHDIEQVLLNHASLSGHLESFELYVTTSKPEDIYWSRISGVAQTVTDREGSRSVTRSHISRLSAAVDVVTVGGGWGFAEDDELDVDEFKDGDDSEDEDKRDGEEPDSNDMQVV